MDKDWIELNTTRQLDNDRRLASVREVFGLRSTRISGVDECEASVYAQTDLVALEEGLENAEDDVQRTRRAVPRG